MGKFVRAYYAVSLYSIILLFASLQIWGCSKDKSVTPTPKSPLIELKGAVSIAPGVNVTPDDLKAVTLGGEYDVSPDGRFSVESIRPTAPQVIFLTSVSSGEVVYIGLADPVKDTLIANDSSTVLALTLFNPYLIMSDSADRLEYLEAVKSSPRFGNILRQIRSAYVDDPASVFDHAENPQLFQALCELMREATSGGVMGKRATSLSSQQSQPPYIEDRSGSEIAFVNPRFVYYAAGIYRGASEEPEEVLTLSRRDKVVDTRWGWPPVYITEPAETPHSLTDGSYKIYIAQGYDFSKMLQWDDPKGRATLFNVGQGIIYFIDLVVGAFPVPDFASLPQHLNISAERSWKFSKALAAGDVTEFVLEFAKLLIDNSEEIAYWIWQEAAKFDASHFVKAVGTFLKKITFVLKILGFANEQLPFFYDVVTAPREATYFISQSGGTTTNTGQDDPPAAVFSIYPPAGIVGTNFQFDASGSYDDHDPLSQLRFRWDFDGDGSFETQWLTSPSTNHSYSDRGAYQVELQVRDTRGLVSQVAEMLSVNGGAGSARHIKLFRDDIPWFISGQPPYDRDATVEVLNDLGFAYGTSGANTYEIVTSDQFDDATLSPGIDLVIISNDQVQTFYDKYADLQVRFNDFVYGGGSMLWEACDRGWNEGNMSSAGVILPNDVRVDDLMSYYNYIVAPDLPLLAGLPSTMDHNYASHERFHNVPGGATIYCVDSDDQPTLVEYNFGDGWVILTGQPLEHQYRSVYGDPDMEAILPRLIAYFTGKQLSRTAPNVAISGGPGPASHKD